MITDYESKYRKYKQKYLQRINDVETHPSLNLGALGDDLLYLKDHRAYKNYKKYKRKYKFAQIGGTIGHPSAKPRGWGPPLFNAVCNNDPKEVKTLISEGDDVNEGNSDGIPPLFMAVSNGYVDIVRALLYAKNKEGDYVFKWENIDKGEGDGVLEKGSDSPLRVAAMKGNVDIVKMLLTAGDKSEEQHKRLPYIPYDRETPLSAAVREGHKEVIRLLLAKEWVVNDHVIGLAKERAAAATAAAAAAAAEAKAKAEERAVEAANIAAAAAAEAKAARFGWGKKKKAKTAAAAAEAAAAAAAAAKGKDARLMRLLTEQKVAEANEITTMLEGQV